MPSARSDRSRRLLILGCLAAALLLVIALGAEAISAARAQRDAVEGVLRDYATLAAEQYGRNVSVTLDYEWTLPTLRLIDSGALDFDALEPLAADTEVAGQRETYRLGDLATGFFVIDGPTAPMRYIPVAGAGEPDLDALADTVKRHNRSRYESDWPYAALLQPADAGAVLVAYRRAGDTPYPVTGMVGTAAALPDFLARAVTVYALLPATLTEGAGDAPLVRVRTVDASGTTLFAHGPEGTPAIGGRFDLAPRLAGLHVASAIPASSAERLVVGGLPYSRLPLIAGMLLLTVALLAAGGLLWRRERELIALREQFVAGASHELRTPLAQIRMFAETLRLERVRSGEERERSLEVIDREARRLSVLVDNLLQFSNPDRRVQQFVPEQVDLGSLVSEVVDGFGPIAAAGGARIVTNIGDDAASSAAPGTREVTNIGEGTGISRGPGTEGPAAVRVAADRDMLRQVVVNLLDNAVKYGPAGQTVTVEVLARPREAVIAVTDQGPGVPPAERALVWQRFWRGPRTNSITGTGIGLALVQELVALHGGSVAVAAGPDGGARFEIRLPREAA